MISAAAKFGSRYAAPAAATGTILALSLSPTVVEAKAEPNAKTVVSDVAPIRRAIADIIEDDAERRGDGTSLTGTFVRVREELGWR
jgi:hypothetical protein